ncbi:MAG: hypothetical protein NZO16_02585 [Deltaproteobacteria bacterium]|nr:hypothetical protein [Deltaproteobacteria bacterium]
MEERDGKIRFTFDHNGVAGFILVEEVARNLNISVGIDDPDRGSVAQAIVYYLLTGVLETTYFQ